MRARTRTLALVLGVTLAGSAAAQKILLEVPTPSYLLDFGAAVAYWPDLDGDGIDDLAVGIPQFTVGGTGAAGAVVVYSSGTGKRLLAFLGDQKYGYFGDAIARLGDVDGDGVDDMAVGEVHGVSTGRVHVFSGATGTLVHLFKPKAFSDAFGFSVADAGDWDGDGVTDIAVGDPYRNSPYGWIYVYSGATGQRLFTLTDPSFVGLGHSLAGIGDVNGDGFDDLLAGAPGGAGVPAAAVVLAGGSGAVLWRHRPALSDKSRFGHSLAALGDVDGDGRPDYAIGAPWSGIFPEAFVAVYSGASHALLWQKDHATALYFGWSLTATDDLDLDGARELAVGQPAELYGGGQGGSSISIFSGATGAPLGRLREPTSTLGISLAGGSDVNGDGLADLLTARSMEVPSGGSVAVISPR